MKTILIITASYFFCMHWAAWRIARYYPNKPARYSINLSWAWPVILIIAIPFWFRNMYVRITKRVDPELQKQIDEGLKKAAEGVK